MSYSRRGHAGHMLEAAVSKELERLGVDFKRTEPHSEDDVRWKVDFLVWTADPSRPPFEIQLTYRCGVRAKIRSFVRAGLVSLGRRGPRIYIEVKCHRQQDPTKTAGRVARAIRTITQSFRDFGPFEMIGVRVDARDKRSGEPAINRFPIIGGGDGVTIAWVRSVAHTIQPVQIVDAERTAQRRRLWRLIQKRRREGGAVWWRTCTDHEPFHTSNREKIDPHEPIVRTRYPLRLP